MTKYKYTAEEAEKFTKHGVDLTVYSGRVPGANVTHVHVEKGHFEEFFDAASTYMYYICSGEGVFVLDDEAVEVKSTDLLVIPPKTRIHYFGAMDILLVVTPAFNGGNEHHVRDVPESESPYSKPSPQAKE